MVTLRGCLPDILYSISELVYIRPSIQLFLFTDSLIQFTVPPFARTFLSGNLRCNHSNVYIKNITMLNKGLFR